MPGFVASIGRLCARVDDSLKDTFGETATAIVYRHLERNHSSKQEEIPKKLEVFIEGLEKFLVLELLW